jgi:hypothetical protein
MGLRDNEYKLTESIELDEGFFETVNKNLSKDEINKRGRGSQKQTTVKMKVIHNLKSETIINQKIETGVEPSTDVVTDSYSSYKKISSTVNHTAHKVDKTNVNKVLPWVHKAISNAKRLLLDVHHRIDDDFLENYLNEFCYKFNRRYFQDKTMERLIIAGVNHQWNEL